MLSLGVMDSSTPSNMQRQQSFYSSAEQLPQARISEGTRILISTAGSAANERRGQKTIMNCFRDRTPSYTRSNSHIARANGGLQQPSKQQQASTNRHETQAPRPRPVKLTLLKSASTRDLSRLLESEEFQQKQSQLSLTTSTSTTDLTKMTSSSVSSASSSSSSAAHCSSSCLKYIQQLEQKINGLERQLNQQGQDCQEMSKRLQELHKKMDLITKDLDTQNKRKKINTRPTKKDGSPTTATGPVVVQPSKLVAWMKLSNFWKQRPSIQTLKEQNIYNGE